MGSQGTLPNLVDSSRHQEGSLGKRMAFQQQHTKLRQPRGGLLHLRGMTALRRPPVDSQVAVVAVPVGSQLPAVPV